MDKSAQEILTELNILKSRVIALEDAYRKVCECNEFLPGVTKESLKHDQNYYARKLYKTCKYHEIRIVHSYA